MGGGGGGARRRPTHGSRSGSYVAGSHADCGVRYYILRFVCETALSGASDFEPGVFLWTASAEARAPKACDEKEVSTAFCRGAQEEKCEGDRSVSGRFRFRFLLRSISRSSRIVSSLGWLCLLRTRFLFSAILVRRHKQRPFLDNERIVLCKVPRALLDNSRFWAGEVSRLTVGAVKQMPKGV